MISQPILEEKAQVLPSNQQVAEATTNQPQSSEDEFDDGGLYTLFIGPGTSTTYRKRTATENRELALKQELDKFHAKYLADTDTLDRASNHLEALQKARASERTPAKMKINIQPLVIQQEDDTFKQEWQAAIKQGEAKLMETVQKHLGRIIQKTKIDIRRTMGETYQKLQTIATDKTTAKNRLEEVLKTANKDRNQKTEQKLKKKRERNDKEAQDEIKKNKKSQS